MHKIISTEHCWIESDAVDQLKKLSMLEGMVLAVGYPDLHPGKTPVGAAFVTKGVIYPHLIGNDIGCSISLYETSLLKKKFKVDQAVKALENMQPLKEKSQGTFNLGTIGGGNHFGEFAIIDEVIDEEGFKAFGADKNKVYLLVHSGSRGLGEMILNESIQKYQCQNGLLEGSEGFEHYFRAYEEATDFAKQNRDLVAYALCETINVKVDQLKIEAVHNGLVQKEGYYVHRKGAVPADEGYVVIAGTRGTSSYIVKPIETSLELGFSIAHGAGRKWKREGCKEKLQGKYLRKDIKRANFGYKLVCKDKALVYEEAPEAYKNIEKVIEALVHYRLIQVIAKLKPLITYKG